MVQFFRVGVITSTHGLHGEVNVFPTTEDPGRFHKGLSLIFDNGKKKETHEIESVRHFKQMVILKFVGLDSIEAVEPYRQYELYVRREDAIPLEEGEYYVADLLSMKVVDEEGQKIGTLTDVMETGANDVYVVSQEDGKELLLPNIPECILDVDPESGVMTVHVMKGLRDL